MKQTDRSTKAYQHGKVRFILVNGLLKRGTLLAIFLFVLGYLLRLEPSSFGDHLRIAIFGGVIFGLLSGFIAWHQTKRDQK